MITIIVIISTIVNKVIDTNMLLTILWPINSCIFMNFDNNYS